MTDWYATGIRLGRWSLSLLGLGLLVVAMFFLLGGGMGAPDIWARLLAIMQSSLPITVCIAGLSWTVMPFAAASIGDRHAWIRWPVYLTVMTATAIVGTVLAGLYYYTLANHFGLADPFRQSFWGTVREALQTSIPITWVLGSMITIHGTVTARLQAAELALRNQQLEKERAEKLAAEAQLASLASRVQPHFLFNTLNAISALVRDEPARAEAMIERLATLLRSSLDNTPTVPLQQELQLVTDYLELQRERFGERLRYEVHATAGTDASVPPFSIQTVVENCLKHVASRCPEGVALTVRTANHGGALVVDVTDDGPGFAADTLKAGGGLDNLQARLRALYGEKGRLEFQRGAAGMTVRMQVPAS